MSTKAAWLAPCYAARLRFDYFDQIEFPVYVRWTIPQCNGTALSSYITYLVSTQYEPMI